MSDTPTADGDASSTTTRRSVLKAAGATAAAGLATTAAAGTAAADAATPGGSGAHGVEPVTADRAAAETAFDWHADELLADLEADGVIVDRSALSLEPGDFGAMVADRDGTAVVRDRDTGVHEVRTVQQVGGGEVAMAVEVETGRAYAVFSPAGTDERLLYDPDYDHRGSAMVEVNDQCDCFCGGAPCDETFKLSEECVCCGSTGGCRRLIFCGCP